MGSSVSAELKDADNITNSATPKFPHRPDIRIQEGFFFNFCTQISQSYDDSKSAIQHWFQR